MSNPSNGLAADQVTPVAESSVGSQSKALTRWEKTPGSIVPGQFTRPGTRVPPS